MNYEISNTKRYLILFSTCIATFMATLDGSIVNITLPVIAKYFSVNINSVQWIVTSYLLTISSILLIWGKLSDIYGKKYLFAAGMAIFTLGSILCGISSTFSMLVFSRVLQAIGASITMALVQGIVTSIFPSNERGKALGIVATVVAVGSLTGPSLGGLLVHLAGWRSIFFVNIPFGIAGVFFTLILMKNTKMKTDIRAFDIKGSIIFVFSITLMFIGLLSLQEGVISKNKSLLMVCLSLILIIIFIQYEKRQANPLLDMGLFKNSMFSISLAAAYISYLSMFAYIFFMPFYLQYVLKTSILKAGLIMSVYPVTTGIIAPISGWFSDKKSKIPLTIVGLSTSTIALILFAFLGAASLEIQIIFLIMLLGIGNAIFQSPNTSAIMGSVSRDKLGVAGSINAFFRNLGMVSGTTLSVILFTLVTNMGINNISNSTFNASVFLKGFRMVMLNASILSFLAVILSAFRDTRRSQIQ